MIAGFLVLAIAAGLGVFVAEFGVSVGGVDVGGSERRWLAERTYDFLEDIQFKDFDRASTYHLKATQTERDIPALIQRVFQIRHETLDIVKFKILEVDLDRSKSRCRVRTSIWYRVLGDSVVTDNSESRRQAELLFYWFRDSKTNPPSWTMELSSSL